jgi:hypothetical protein
MSKQTRNDHVIVILHNVEILDQTHNCEQVHAILLIIPDSDKNKNVIIEEDYKKVVGVFKDQNSMLIKLQQVIVDVEHQVAQDVEGVFSTFIRKERTLQDVRHEFGLFMWRQVFKSKYKSLYTLS